MHKAFRQSALVLSKAGFSPSDVLAMSHAEVGEWIDSYLDSIGVKRPKTILSMRRKKPSPPPSKNHKG